MNCLWDYVQAVKAIALCTIKGWLFRCRKWLGWGWPDVHAIESLYDSLDPATVTYSQVWEDPRTMRKSMRIQEGDKVICVCSGGDNAIAMLLDNPGLVLAVDFCGTQVAVAELKRLSIKYLTYDLFKCLVGIGPPVVEDESRADIYIRHLRPKLPEWLSTFWDKHLDLIENGLIHCGIYEKYFSVFAHIVRPLVHNDRAVAKLFSCPDIATQKQYFESIWDTWLWRMLCRIYFGDVLIGRCPPFYERSNANIGEHFVQRIAHTMKTSLASDNFYLEYILTGDISGKYALPDYLDPKNFYTLKSRIDKLRFVEGDIVKTLEKTDEHFNAINLSNIFDFIPESEHKTYKETVLTHAGPNTRVVHWTFVPVSEDCIDFSSFGSESIVDVDLSKQLNYEERAWFYQTFIVQTVNSTKKAKAKNGLNGHKRNGFAKISAE